EESFNRMRSNSVALCCHAWPPARPEGSSYLPLKNTCFFGRNHPNFGGEWGKVMQPLASNACDCPMIRAVIIRPFLFPRSDDQTDQTDQINGTDPHLPLFARFPLVTPFSLFIRPIRLPETKQFIQRTARIFLIELLAIIRGTGVPPVTAQRGVVAPD